MTTSPPIQQVNIRPVSNGYVVTVYVINADPAAMTPPAEVIFSTFADIGTYLAAQGFGPTVATT